MVSKILPPVLLLLVGACDFQADHQQAAKPLAPVPQAQDILVHNANIYSMAKDNSTATAMLFDSDGEIKRLGADQELLQSYPDARRIDLHGKTVLPGLIDSHGHLYGLAISLSQAQLQGTRSKAGVIRKLREHALKLGAGDWLLGRGWDQNDWPVQVFPTREDLDSVFPDRPVWLRRIDGHAAWANSAALAMADADLSGNWQPQGGFIHRDNHGEATGVLVDGAMALVDKAVPEISQALLVASLDLALQRMVRLGLTGVHDPGISRAVIELYRQRIRAGHFPTRVYAMADGAGATLDWLCENGAQADPSGRLFMRTAKFYIDGALGSRGAADMAGW